MDAELLLFLGADDRAAVERADKARAEPWFVSPIRNRWFDTSGVKARELIAGQSRNSGLVIAHDAYYGNHLSKDGRQYHNDMKFMAHARTDLPRMAERLAKTRKMLHEVLSGMDRWLACPACCGVKGQHEATCVFLEAWHWLGGWE